MEMMVNIKEVEDFITSGKFTDFLVSNTVNIGTAGFILQTLLDKVKEIKTAEEN